MSEIESLKYQIDALAGAQFAMAVALNLSLTIYRGNQELITALENDLERVRATLLSSSSSDYKIHAFDEIAEGYLTVLKKQT